MTDANAKTFNFELVSPDRILVSEPAWQVIIPGEEGYFGVRAGHMSLIAAIKPGVVEVYKTAGAAPEKIFIAGGFADVTAANCTILAEQAVNVNDLDAAALESELKDLKEDLSMANDAASKTQADKKIALTEIKLKIAQSKAA
ncbi:MAG TPA: F0F1 ATP synthase subunit epsilon [Micavibrio sp.]|nr:F0F1 ATP synthase subunit epsilon [Micavibrio sp.]